MIKLKSQTFHYIYTDEKDFFISEDAPIRSDKEKKWYHEDLGYRCINFVVVKKPEISSQLQDFYAVNIDRYIKKEDG